MTSHLDTVHDRHDTGSTKWNRYPADVLPLWIADMDFAVAPGIIQALQARLTHPMLGYSVAQDSLRETLVTALRELFDWEVAPEELVFLPGVEGGVNMALNGLLAPGTGVVVQTPNYRPLLNAAGHWKLPRIDLPFHADANGLYPTDLAALEAALGNAGAMILSNPHNPLGKVFDRAELQAIADACVAHDTLLISDEIHAQIVFDGRKHIPIASLNDEIAQRTITLMSATKAFNIAGMKNAFAVIRNPALRHRFNTARQGMVDSVSTLGLVATEAAFKHGKEWLAEVIAYLQANRDYLVNAVATRLPGVSMITPQATYLAWLDCTALGLEDPHAFFLKEAKVGLSPGTDFADEGAGQFVRLNFGCPRALLEEGIARMAQALETRNAPPH
ncbi:MalY/PatB family protein [Pseudomonas eucalypticola]|uniref:cysteine-S-conjugate beta-lyase n=1 Tax=Pseudomonas eucalypticola TaxID=2599595 RepID=A0A7D5HVY1_9PSED|nr:MalY/PatB family protein [Pseudomonas eucalypticola]QKZ03991.1 pyridoxal phosphate-dependent aminotransferase [Pseudomonas eucalypticola]